jgi:Bacterial PH domain
MTPTADAAPPPTVPSPAPHLSRDDEVRVPPRARAQHVRPSLVHASDTGGAGAGAGAATAEERRALFPSLATLLTGHLLRDGEVVLLILKPSVWLILFSVLRFSAAVLIVVIAANLWLPDRHKYGHHYIYAGAFAIAARLMWAVLVWIGRLYILTDLRILRLSGVFTVEIFDCPLRKVGHTRVTYSFRERLWRLGSIEVTPADDSRPPFVWQTVRRPVEVHEQIVAAIRQAKEGGCAGEWT